MDLLSFYKGLVIGFSIAAPVGPIGILCIKRTLSSGWLTGLVSGIGAATADSFYGSVAAFGLTLVAAFLIHWQVELRLVGGAFLCYLGLKSFFARPQEAAIHSGRLGIWSAYASTFFLTLTNPLTILSFGAVFAGFGLAGRPGDYTQPALTVLGVFCGSAAWWFLLSGTVQLIRSKFQPGWLVWINRLAGGIIVVFGIAALLSTFTNYR